MKKKSGEVNRTKTLWSAILNKVPTLAELPSSLYFKRSDKRADQTMPRGWLIFKPSGENCPQPFRLHNQGTNHRTHYNEMSSNKNIIEMGIFFLKTNEYVIAL